MIRFSTSGRDSWSATPVDAPDEALVWDFLSFLASAQELKVDFLPITWQPALSDVGEGGTAEIRQSLISLQMSFAFKVIKDAEWIDAIDESQRPEQIKTHFQALIAEISVLGHHSIRKHPNVISLLGVCWHILPSSLVWLVLVLEKAPFGDLWKFARSEIGKDLSFEARLKLCTDIVIAVRDLHQYGIIHGDIKPHNVLIFKDDSGLYTAKAADFGYSTIFSGQGTIAMPQSKPWSAPERTERNRSTFQEALKMDAYSFGMLCLWLLSDQYPLPIDRTMLRTNNTDAADFADKSIHARMDLEKHQREMLRELYSMALPSNPLERSSDFNHFLCCLTSERSRGCDLPEYAVVNTRIASCKFSVVPSILQFYEADVRIRSFIATALRDNANSISSEAQSDRSFARHYAFQLALCLRIGFGVARDEELCMSYLKKSHCVDNDLNLEIERLKGPLKDYQSGVFTQQLRAGYILAVDLPDRSSDHHTPDKIIAILKRELLDLQCKLSVDHRLVLIMKTHLAHSLMQQQHLAEAEIIQLQVVESHQRTKGPKHRWTLTNTSSLAEILGRQGRYMEAEKLHRSTLHHTEEMLGSKHPLTKTCLANLANALADQDQYELAEKLHRQSLEITHETLGPEHPQTLISIHSLADGMSKQGKHEMAASTFRQALDLRKKVLGIGHPATLTTMSSLACEMKELGKYKVAEEVAQETLKQAINWLGPTHRQTLRSINELASIFSRQGKYDRAEDLHRKTLDSSRKLLGPHHLDTLSSMGNLAAALQELGKYEAAEETSRQVLELDLKISGPEHSTTLTTQNNLGLLLNERGKHQEAEELHRKTLDLRARILGPQHPYTLTTMNNLSLSLVKQNKYDEADELYHSTLEAMQNTLGPEHPETLTIMFNRAYNLKRQDKLAAAEMMSQATLDLRIKVLGLDHPHTMATERLLASILKRGTTKRTSAKVTREHQSQSPCERLGHLHS